jgi:hypothetical protein
MTEQISASTGSKDQHITCTSTPLEKEGDSEREKIDNSVLKKWFLELFGYPMSDDPIVANIQSEQAITKHKRLKK